MENKYYAQLKLVPKICSPVPNKSDIGQEPTKYLHIIVNIRPSCSLG